MHSPVIDLLELETVDSTNQYAKDNFAALADGTFVSAEMQSAGRGRLGRRWLSPAGVNIYATLVMKRIDNPFYATVTSSLAVLDMLQNELPRADFFIKWPNDVYVGHRKISGILCESLLAGNAVSGVLAGIGVNINMEQADLEQIGQPAASLKALSGKNYDVKELTRKLAASLARTYGLYLDNPAVLFAEWKEANRLIGRNVTLAGPDGTPRQVRVLDIAETGELVTEENGIVRLFHCGDVVIRKEELFRRQ